MSEDESPPPGRQLRDRMARLAAHAQASGIPIEEPLHEWADQLAATLPGQIVLKTHMGRASRPTGSLTNPQIASIQMNQLEYGDTIEWAISFDDATPIKGGKPG